jgi:CBS domain-containing protein
MVSVLRDGLDPGAGTPTILSLRQQATLARILRTGEPPRRPVLSLHVVDGDLDLDAAERALLGVVARHDVLRLQLSEGGGGWRASTAPPSDLAVLDTRTGSVAAALTRIERFAAQAIDLAAGRLMAAARVVTDQVALFAVLTDQICFDGWSYQVLMNELEALTGAGADPAPLAEQYWRYARRQRAWVEANWAEITERIRRRYGPGPAYPSALAPRSGHGHGPATQRRVLTARIDPAGGARFLTAARRLHATPFVAWLSSLYLALARAGEPEIGLLTPTSRRSWPPTHAMIGEFADTSVIRVPGPDVPFPQLVVKVRTQLAQAMDRDVIPFDWAVGAFNAGVPWQDEIHPMVMFRHVRAPLRTAVAGALLREISPKGLGLATAGPTWPDPLVLISVLEAEPEEPGKGWTLEIEYSGEYVEDASARVLLDRWRSRIMQVGPDPGGAGVRTGTA